MIQKAGLWSPCEDVGLLSDVSCDRNRFKIVEGAKKDRTLGRFIMRPERFEKMD